MNHRLLSLLDSMKIYPDRITPVHGGDINDSFRLSFKGHTDWFVKMNKPGKPKEIITAESEGLEMLEAHGVTMLPAEVRYGENSRDACLVMLFYEAPDRVDPSSWSTFFRNLASMHKVSKEVFGGKDNYIGSLPQHNTSRNNWVPFYRENRLVPQWEMAHEAGWFTTRDGKDWESFLRKMPDFMPIERPSLIHGDLWSGNIHPSIDGVLLIDPCPYFGHREMDLAMMQLFSGIPVGDFMSEYTNIFPLVPGLDGRIEIYQLYYLLVHLNLFGAPYLPAVRRIIQRFS